MESIQFTKLHGIGNDYLYIDCINYHYSTKIDFSDLAAKMSNRHCGVGSDGIILILSSQVADFKMRIFNADGSEAEMCGNGLRGFAKYVFDHCLINQNKFKVETLAGIVTPEVIEIVDNRAKLFCIDMNEPVLKTDKIPAVFKKKQIINEELKINKEKYHITCVSMGNPHCIIFVDQITDYHIYTLGPRIENHPMFPHRTNVEFIEIINKDEVNFRVWERGSGETLACGTGACAGLVAGVLNHYLNRKVLLHLKGGDLMVEWNQENNHIYMTGTAEEVFSGLYQYE